jgi:hypothetical protein
LPIGPDFCQHDRGGAERHDQQVFDRAMFACFASTAGLTAFGLENRLSPNPSTFDPWRRLFLLSSFGSGNGDCGSCADEALYSNLLVAAHV